MHMIDQSNEQENIAYVGETPWHSLGQRLQPGQSVATWAVAAGLSHDVRRAAVEFHDGTQSAMFAERNVLYRSDTLKPLSVVGHRYKIVQPSEVLGFFEKLVEHNNFTLETAGSLDGGKRVWALAKVSDGAPVIGHDVVKPYVLLATSYDASLATIAKFTTVRVVCHNTLTMSVGYQGEGQSERDAVGSVIRVPHSIAFNAKEVALDLGIAFTAFDKFLIETRKLAKRPVNETFATAFLKMLLPPPIKTIDGVKVPQPVEDSKAFQSILALFKGEALGSGLPEANGTAWGLLNAVTQYTDWQAGRSDNARIRSAWFGDGDALKQKARDTLIEVCS